MEFFPSTRWSVVINAGLEQGEALEQLCRTYWYPIYAYARSTGSPAPDAEDLVQGFFEHMLGHDLIARADPKAGKFRSYLLTCFKNFQRSEYARATRLKRGGTAKVLSFEELDAETRYAHEPMDAMTPERLYDRSWAIAVLERAHNQLAEDYSTPERSRVFQALRVFLQGRGVDSRYAEVAEALGKTEAAVKMEVMRMRKRLGEGLRRVVEDTVASPAETEDEVRYLIEVLSA
jgi:RNA polymerase sigma-70 factor (ECF subfamily)